MTQLTEALGFLSAPVTAALACQHGGQGELVTLVAGVANTWAPGQFCAHNLSVGDAGWRAAHDCCKQTRDVSFFPHTFLFCNKSLCMSCYAALPLQRGLVPFQVRSLVQMRVEARSASIVNPGEHWKVAVWLYVKSFPNLTPLAGTPGSPQLMTAQTKDHESHCRGGK